MPGKCGSRDKEKSREMSFHGTFPRSRRFRMWFRSERAVSGFFEDIPALIVVTIALAMFILTSVFAMVQHNKQSNLVESSYKYFDIMKTIRSYDGLCYIEEGSANRLEGFFDAKKVFYLSVINITRDIPDLGGIPETNSDVPDYYKSSTNYAKVKEWRLIIQDFSNYPFKYSVEVNNTYDMATSLKKPNRDNFISGVNIRVSDEEIHVAKMTLTIFQWNEDYTGTNQ